MKNCIKCGKPLPMEDALYCCYCGKKQNIKVKAKKTRGNGEGSVYKQPNGKWTAEVTYGYIYNEITKKIVRKFARKKGFKTKAEALAYVPTLKNQKLMEKKNLENVGFKELYDIWYPIHRQDTSRSTMYNYQAAMGHFSELWECKFNDISIEDYQDAMDNCPFGKRTRQNMRTLIKLLFQYALPRGYCTGVLNIGEFLKVRTDEEAEVHFTSFNDIQIEMIKKGIGRVPYAEYIYCLIYTGFRPTEFLGLKISDYDKKEKTLVAGIKTEAGKNRTVTISPKIQQYIDKAIGVRKEGYIFVDGEGNPFTIGRFRKSVFYPAMEQLGFQGPDVHTYVPYSCRHTFSDLLKNIQAADKDKLELMGHSDTKMLRYYQTSRNEDLRKITNQI